MTTNLDYLVHHEAGHAAVAFHLGLRLGPIIIDEANDSGSSSEKGTPLQEVLVALAGGRAEKRLDPVHFYDRCATARDEERVLEIIDNCLRERFGSSHTDAQIYRMGELADAMAASRCARIVDQRWSAIQRLAAVLAQKRRLTGEVAERVLAY